MTLRIQIRGLKRLNRFMINLPKHTEKEIFKKSKEFMVFVKKSARLRAPKSTGELARSINFKVKGKQIVLTVDSPYAIFQEEGFTPHWVHAGLPTRNSLGTIGNAFNIAGFAFVSKHTPFIKPALEAGLNQLPSMLNKGIKQAIIKSRR